MSSIAPYPFERLETRPDIPDTGRFLLPLCLNKEELIALLSSLERYRRLTGVWDVTALFPVLQAVEFIGRPEEALCYEGGYDGQSCLSYPAFASFIQFFPNDPYNPTGEVPENYLLPPFWRWGELDGALPDYLEDWFNNALEDFTGYKPNDAIVFIASFPFTASWDDFLDLGGIFPRIEIKVSGKGQANLEFLAFPAGGRVIVEVDQMPNIVDIVLGGFLDPDSTAIDTDRDLTSFPPEENVVSIIPVEIEEEGDHTIFAVWLPIVNDSAFPVGFGGGFRSVELCGGLRPFGETPVEPPDLEGVTELRPQFQFTVDCGLEYRLLNQDSEVVQDWTPVEGWTDNAALCFGGGDTMTMEDYRDGIVAAAEIIGLRIGSGEIIPFSVDSEGNVDTSGSTGGTGGTDNSGLPVDNPATVIDERESARYGGDIEVAEKLETFIAQVDTLYGPVNGTPVNSATDAKNLLGFLYPVEIDLMSAAIDTYYAWRATNGRLLWSADAVTAQYFYCNGFSKNAIARYFFTLGFTTQKFQVITGLIFALSDLFFSSYYEVGTAKPSNAYLDAACVPMPFQSFEDIPYGSTRTLLPTVAKGGHRLKIKVSGHYVDPDGDIQDAFWYRTAAGVLTRSNFTFSHAAGANMPSDNQVVYNSAHVYEYTIDLATGSSSWSVIFNRNSNMNVASTSPTGGFDIAITDLGLAVSQ